MARQTQVIDQITRPQPISDRHVLSETRGTSHRTVTHHRVADSARPKGAAQHKKTDEDRVRVAAAAATRDDSDFELEHVFQGAIT